MECTLRYVCFPFLFFLPQYFASRAVHFLRNAQAADGSLHVRNDNQTSGVQIGPTESAPQDITLSSVARPADAHFDSSPFRAWNDVPSLSSEHMTHPDNSTLKQVESSWIDYIEYCCKLWTIVASVAGTILLASPPILQMPGTNEDPLVRSFVYLFIFRLISTLLMAIILLYHFRENSQSRSSAYAMAWYKTCKKNSQMCSNMSWAILASPAVVFCWGILFLIVALYLAVWRTGLSTSPLPMQDLPLSLPRLVITLMSVVDVVYCAWLMVTLRSL